MATEYSPVLFWKYQDQRGQVDTRREVESPKTPASDQQGLRDRIESAGVPLGHGVPARDLSSPDAEVQTLDDIFLAGHLTGFVDLFLQVSLRDGHPKAGVRFNPDFGSLQSSHSAQSSTGPVLPSASLCRGQK